MKRTILSLTIILAVVTLIAAFSCPATAAVKGRCDDCHTMHNSQGGNPMRWDENAAPLSALLRGTCLGCHTTDGTDPLGEPDSTGTEYPFVFTMSETAFHDDNCLAGGFFTDGSDPTDNNSNNQHSLGTKRTTSIPWAPKAFRQATHLMKSLEIGTLVIQTQPVSPALEATAAMAVTTW